MTSSGSASVNSLVNTESVCTKSTVAPRLTFCQWLTSHRMPGSGSVVSTFPDASVPVAMSRSWVSTRDLMWILMCVLMVLLSRGVGADSGSADSITLPTRAAVFLGSSCGGFGSRWRNTFVLDTGSQLDLVRHKDWLSDIDYSPAAQMSVGGVHNTRVMTEGVGVLKTFVIDSTGKTCPLILRKVCYLPGLQVNLLSSTSLLSKKGDLHFNFNRTARLLCGGVSTVIPLEIDQATNYFLLPTFLTADTSTARTKTAFPTRRHMKPHVVIPGDLLHRRMGHCGSKAIEVVARMYPNVEVKDMARLRVPQWCSVCVQAKFQRHSAPATREEEAIRVGQRVHLDSKDMTVAGYFGTKNSRMRYFLVFIDEYSRNMYAYFTSSFTTEAAEEILNAFRKDLGHPIEEIQTDSDSVFMHSHFLMAAGSTKVKPSPPGRHEYNGLVERAIRTLCGGIRALLCMHRLPVEFWCYAAQSYTYLYNRTPHSALGFRSPYEVLHERRPP